MKTSAPHHTLPGSQYEAAAPSSADDATQANTVREYASPTVCRLDLLSETRLRIGRNVDNGTTGS